MAVEDSAGPVSIGTTSSAIPGRPRRPGLFKEPIIRFRRSVVPPSQPEADHRGYGISSSSGVRLIFADREDAPCEVSRLDPTQVWCNLGRLTVEGSPPP